MVGVNLVWVIRRLYGCRFCGTRIDRVPKFFGRLEEGDTFGGDVYLGSGFWIAPGTCVALPCPKASKSPDFDLVAGLESADDGFEEGIDDDLAVTTGEVAESGYLVDKICFGHE